MTIVLREGYDYYNGTGTNGGLGDHYTTRNGSMSLVTGRFGGQALRYQSGTSTSGCYRAMDSAISSGSVGVAFRAPNLTSATAEAVAAHIALLNGVSGYQLGLRIRLDGGIDVVRMTAANAITVLASSAAGVIPTNVWKYIEWEFSIHDTTGYSHVYVDDVQVITATGLDTLNSGATVSHFQLGLSQHNSTYINVTEHDDVYVADTARLGPQKIETIRVTGNGAHQDSTPSTGADRAAMIDETTVSNTDYNQFSTVGHYDEYALGDLSSSPSVINEINIVAYMSKTDATARQMALGVDSGGTVSKGSNYSLGTGFAKAERRLTQNPNGSVAWTKTSVDALILRPEVMA